MSETRNEIARRIGSRTSKVSRWFAIGCLLGLIVFVAGVQTNNDWWAVGLLMMLICLLFVGLHPLGYALGAGLRSPEILPELMRNGAAIGGLFSLFVAWRVVDSGRVNDGPMIAALIALAGIIGLACAFRPPRPDARRLPVSVLVACLLIVGLSRLPKMFAGYHPEAYYARMQRFATDMRDWQEMIREDSGHYTTSVDTSLGRYDLRSGNVSLRLEADSQSYRAWVTSPRLDGRYSCGLYHGDRPAEPATVPDSVMCTLYPDAEVQGLGQMWLLGIVLSGVIGLVIRKHSLV